MANTVETQTTLQYSQHLWEDSVAACLDEAELPALPIQLASADLRITNFV